MNNYEQLRRHWTHLPELPNPDSVDINAWTHDDPKGLKATINRHNVWGYVDSRVQNRIDALIKAAEPPPKTPEEILAEEIAAYESAKGPTARVVSSPKVGGPSIAWNEVSGWKPERYQAMGRSIARWGRDAPVKDDPFGRWEQGAGGEWNRVGVQQSWVSLGGYDPAKGPWVGACWNYPITKRWLELSGDGPWQITVAAYWKGRGWVYGNIIEWPEREIAPEPEPEPSRMDLIVASIKTFTGRRTRDGRPYVRDLRKHAGMPDITTSERNKAHKLASSS